MSNFNKLLLLSALAFMLVIVGCSQEESPTQSVPDQESEVPADVQQQMKLAEQYERLIEAMDPFVSQAENGQYVFDEAGFASAQSLLSGSDQQIVNQLRDGISIVNEKVQELTESGAAAKIWFQWYWWGYKECYSEYSAVWMLDLMSRSGYGYSLWYYASRYHYSYGYFCIGHTWAGGVWITL